MATETHSTSGRLKERVTNKQNEYNQNHLLVVGIDIGNTCTKNAFSFVSSYKREPTNILSLPGLYSGVRSTANSTIVLLDDNEQLICFGENAINDYEDVQWHLFRDVKQPLYSNSAGEVRYVKDELGRETPTVKVLHAIIKHIKDHLITKIQPIMPGPEYICWVFTVPAVFTEQAVSIMHEAALMAGIAETHLRIVLEPEAALEYCFITYKHGHRFKHGCTNNTDVHTNFPDRKQFMVVDIGEETLDVTVLQRDELGAFKELDKICGIGYGGNRLHKALDNVFTSIIGFEAYQRFRVNDHKSYMDIHRDFENRVKKEDSNSSTTVKIGLCTNSAFGLWEEEFMDALQKSPYAGKLSVLGAKLRITVKVWQELLDEYCCHVNCLIRDVLTKQGCNRSICVVLVGGYADFKIIQESIIRDFSDIDIFIPSDPQTATVKGAVLLGHRPPSKVEHALTAVNAIIPFQEGDVKDSESEPLQDQECGSDFVQSIKEMSAASDFLDDVAVNHFPKFQAGLRVLQQKIAGRPQTVRLKRKDVITDVITAYRDIDVHRPLKVHFDDEERDVTEEMLSLFWEKISHVWFKGENAVVPLVPMARRAEARHVFPVLGKILEHTLCILGHFPPQICRSLIFAIAHPDKDVDADLVLEDYLLFLPDRESELLSQSLEQTKWSENRQKRLERFFSVIDISVQPTPTSLKENLLDIAYAEIIDSSQAYTSLMRRGISDFAKANVFNVLDTDTLKAEYKSREVTTEKLAQMVEAMFDESEYSREERKIINYLSNFVTELSKKQLRMLLTCLTGSTNMPQKIEIIFNSSRGLTRTSKIHRGMNKLELSRDYHTYQDFKRVIMDVLLSGSSD